MNKFSWVITLVGIVVLVIAYLLFVSHRLKPIGPGLGYHHDYVKFDKKGNFTKIIIQK